MKVLICDTGYCDLGEIKGTEPLNSNRSLFLGEFAAVGDVIDAIRESHPGEDRFVVTFGSYHCKRHGVDVEVEIYNDYRE